MRGELRTLGGDSKDFERELTGLMIGRNLMPLSGVECTLREAHGEVAPSSE